MHSSGGRVLLPCPRCSVPTRSAYSTACCIRRAEYVGACARWAWKNLDVGSFQHLDRKYPISEEYCSAKVLSVLFPGEMADQW